MTRELKDNVHQQKVAKNKKRKREDTDFVPMTMEEPRITDDERQIRHRELLQSQQEITAPSFAE